LVVSSSLTVTPCMTASVASRIVPETRDVTWLYATETASAASSVKASDLMNLTRLHLHGVFIA
jgi:hypothetical protein